MMIVFWSIKKKLLPLNKIGVSYSFFLIHNSDSMHACTHTTCKHTLAFIWITDNPSPCKEY